MTFKLHSPIVRGMGPQVFRALLLGGCAVIAGIVFLTEPMGWPGWIAEAACAVGLTVSLPVVMFGRADLFAGPWFARLRHRLWWGAIYLAVGAAISAHIMGWPMSVTVVSGVAALAGAALLVVAGRPLLTPKGP